MRKSRLITILCTPEPEFLLPGLAAIAVGTAIGYQHSGSLNLSLAFLAAASIIFLNAGSNMLNDYFDHLSGNDWLNFNPTKFGGGSRYIQKDIITPEAMRLAGCIAIGIGVLIGLAIVIITGSLFIFFLGFIGFLGGVFWTAPPVKLCYRIIGEPHIFLMFGLLPAFGAYYLQSGVLTITPLLPAAVVGLHIAVVALINSIPDRNADAAVDKKTFVVRFGVEKAVWFYRICIFLAYLISFLSFVWGNQILQAAGLGHLLTLPIAVICMITATRKTLEQKGVFIPNALTIILYCAAGVVMTAAVALWS